MPSQEIQWFPGHMARTRRLIAESLPLVDAVAELRDARAPESTRNPELGQLIGNKPRIVLLNKSDLADAAATQRWLAFLRAESAAALAVDCRSGKGLNRFAPLVKETLSTVLAHNQARGMQGRPLRLMVVGIPNVGKSSLINRLSRRSRAETADQPGVTRRNQWYRVGSVDGINIELLDTPGVLWPKFEDPIAGETLAFLGSIKSEVLDNESLSLRLLDVLLKEYPARLAERYRICTTGTTPPEALETLARRRGMLQSGGVPDTRRAACMLLDELQAGRLGTLTLDAPPRCNTGSLQE